MDEKDTKQIVTTAIVVGITAGDPPSLTTVKRAVNSQGIPRHITQCIAVRDADLFQRLCAEVKKGDELRLTLVTNLSAADYRMSLLDFSRPTLTETVSLPSQTLASQSA